MGATKVDLILSINEGSTESKNYISNEVFPDFTGHIPRVGEYVLFYRHNHDDCRYCGIVTAINHRIEFKHRDKASMTAIQTVKVNINWKDNP